MLNPHKIGIIFLQFSGQMKVEIAQMPNKLTQVKISLSLTPIITIHLPLASLKLL